jgi:hypothetical protein
MIGIYPVVLGVILWLRQTRTVQLFLEERGIRVLRHGALIPYESIKSITERNVLWSGDPLASPLVIEHAGGRLVVPPRLSVKARDLHDWLAGRVPAPPPRACLPELADYHADQVAKFGPEKVTVIHRRGRTRPPGMGGWGVFLLSVILTALLWGVVAAAAAGWFPGTNERDGWLIAAFIVSFSGIVFAMLGVAISSSRDSKRRAAGASAIVLGPAGMAMKQGPMKGALRWDEIIGVTSAAGQSQLIITVRGARIVVQDIYERSVHDIASSIRAFLG